jgi:proteasome-associated ATPase
MIEAVELPYRNPEIVEFYHRRRIKGVLLYGPPGCGKTMLGKATATSIARMNAKDTKHNGFLYIKGPEILERFVGVAEAVVRQLFQRARKHKEQFGFPAVIFIDEAEALLSKRGSGISSDVEKTMVPMFCTEMDGMEESDALVILATNRPDILDPAIIRNGRIDRKIKIERPTLESAINIFMLNLKDAPLNNGYSHDELARLGAVELFRKDRILYRINVKDRGDVDFALSDIINGGMVAGVVDEAKSIAMKRDIINNVRGGLRKEDIILAVDLIEQQNRDLDHTDELSEFTHDFLGDLTSVKKLCMSVN